MPVITCPSCGAKVSSSGASGVSCPACGGRIGGPPAGPGRPPARSAAAGVGSDRPSRRPRYDDHDEDEDEEYDDRPVRRKKKAKGGSKTLLYVLIGGGTLALLGVLGLCVGGGLYAMKAAEREEAQQRAAAQAAQQAAQQAVPFGGGPAAERGGVPPVAPFPPQPQAQPQAPPPAPPPAGTATVTLSNLRQGRTANRMEVDFQYANNGVHDPANVLVYRFGAGGTGEARHSTTPPRGSGTFSFAVPNRPGQPAVRVEVWMERRTAQGVSGPRISNTLPLN